ncbi:nickel ABC transporter ATP-binding protein [Clostridium carboxidivorans P7]|uniref:ABC transporter related protein n=1 Tax=Clostridium carboxidivorans P7 TaxID=536227 RepID=C6PRH9_9CLOT|nr:ABC transporter ATP-binding protein [Clostridium carboxidivorans]AKN31486.1 nickel ABC transporter ATP-binding protein [Clostridium carboxidivorans P7]EET88160.1 ABC transporter related protein [Clostridium carboxidivorans P7]EFG87116.1 ABC transporter, ATP-binding protein [Clostridium carboxidivorans P7]
MENILEVKELNTAFKTEKGIKEVVKGINFEVKKSKITCIVGQSGSGKSVTAMSIIKMLPKSGYISGGSILFNGEDLIKMTDGEIRKVRGKKIFSIFQNPINCFNPSLTMETQIYDLISSNMTINRKEFENKICSVMEKLNLEDPAVILKQYPFQLSGGMLQRMMIAAAIFMEPEIIIADEPTTALDVTTQKEILKQFKLIQKKFNTTILMITHDFGVVAEMADEVIVMKDGSIVEKGNVFEIFNNPKHPYTISLIKATFDREVLEVC